MCDYCSKNTYLMKTEIIDDAFIGWSNEIKLTDLDYKSIAVMLDMRGYLRLVNVDDYDCLDHGEKIKINYCPMCGREIV